MGKESAILSHSLTWQIEMDLASRTRMRSEDPQLIKMPEPYPTFVKWEAEQAQIVKPVSYQFSKRKKEIDKLQVVEPAKLRQCYRNAAMIAIHAGLDYVEGYMTNGILIYDHAWNAEGERCFDLTEELLLGSSKRFTLQYQQIIRVKPDDIWHWITRAQSFQIKLAVFAEQQLSIKANKKFKQLEKHAQFWAYATN